MGKELPRFVLASASPARRRLLLSVGIEPEVMPSDFDEASVQVTDPAELVQILATKKAETVAQPLFESRGADTGDRPILVLGCDSVLWVNGEIYGKPETEAEAIARWQVMRGQSGELYTGHALMDSASQTTLVRCQVTVVEFAAISDRQIERYVASGEPLKCAGCFALEGKGGLFVEGIRGCHSNVIGLSLPLLRQMLGDLGYDVTDFWGALGRVSNPPVRL